MKIFLATILAFSLGFSTNYILPHNDVRAEAATTVLINLHRIAMETGGVMIGEKDGSIPPIVCRPQMDPRLIDNKLESSF